uniref:GCS light chain n=1 Tax=Strigamia maritima TaxID=126957 RepID=T1J7Y0_STRMM
MTSNASPSLYSPTQKLSERSLLVIILYIPLSDMADSPPRVYLKFPDYVHSLTVHTGNIIHWNELKRKTSQSATDELVETLGETLSTWSRNYDPEQYIGLTNIDCINHKYDDPVDKQMRKDLKVTVKILLCQLDPEGLSEAVTKVLQELRVDFLESVIVSFPSPPNEPLELHHIKPLWNVLERYIDSGQIVTIGVSDLDTELLIALYAWATIKPSINQVNLASCCVMPQEMTAFAKENDIQLLTHNDPKDILPLDVCSGILRSSGCFLDSEAWAPLWIARYSVLVKCRGVIQNKGFLSCLKRLMLAR